MSIKKKKKQPENTKNIREFNLRATKNCQPCRKCEKKMYGNNFDNQKLFPRKFRCSENKKTIKIWILLLMHAFMFMQSGILETRQWPHIWRDSKSIPRLAGGNPREASLLSKKNKIKISSKNITCTKIIALKLLCKINGRLTNFKKMCKLVLSEIIRFGERYNELVSSTRD